MIAPVFTTLRPKQWVKNLILFAGLVFSEQGLLLSRSGWLHALSGFFLFCGLAGCVYILNDIVDVEKDRIHPTKRNRPIASGQLSISEAKATLIILLIMCLVGSWQLSGLFFSSALIYFMINIAYSFKLKNVVILDVMTISFGFVLRAVAGVASLKEIEPNIYISHWLLLATFMLSMFLGLVKRRQELAKLEENATNHRKILSQYSLEYIDQMTSILAAITIVVYAFYCVSPETVHKFHTDKLIYTLPMVIYGIMRYLYIIHIKEQGDNPTEVVLSDIPLQVNLFIWSVLIIFIVHSNKLLTILGF